MEISGFDIRRAIQEGQRHIPHVVFNGTISVVVFEDRVFLSNRITDQVFEVRPDFETGVTIHAL